MRKNSNWRKRCSSLYLIFSFVSYFLLDCVLRRVNISHGIMGQYDKIPLLFVLGWCFILCGLIHILPGNFKKIFMGISITVYAVLTLVHGVYINIFSKFFSVADLSLLSEGTKFMDVSYINIRKIIVLSVIVSIFFMGISIYLIPETRNKYHAVIGIILFLTGIGSVTYAESCFSDNVDAMTWDSASNPSLVYKDFIDTPKCLLMSGLYQYTFRDIQMTFNPFEYKEKEEIRKELNEYFNTKEETHNRNEKTGVFKGKNLILVQLENIDQWILTEKNMPNLYKLKEQSIDFQKHYSVAFATGKTFNTEFIVNTGQVPMMSGGAPSYIYSRNTYPYSLANMFKQKNYSTNSFHGASGSIYNRTKAHATFGYEKYHNFADMKMDDYTMDSQMINGFDLMTANQPFFDFIITISAHGPFSSDTSAAKAHLEQVKQEDEREDETYLAGMAQAKETDEFIKKLIQKLEDSNLIDDTVLVFYTDHYAYSTVSAELQYELKGTDDSNLLQNTPFFIWSKDQEAQEISKVTNTTDILPTLANMFDFELDYKYCVGNDAFDKDYKGYAMFSDSSWYDGEIYWKPTENKAANEYIRKMSEEINKKITNSWKILDADYFAYIKE